MTADEIKRKCASCSTRDFPCSMCPVLPERLKLDEIHIENLRAAMLNLLETCKQINITIGMIARRVKKLEEKS